MDQEMFKLITNTTVRIIRLYEQILKKKSNIKIRILYKQEVNHYKVKIINCKLRNRYNGNLLVEPNYRFQADCW